MSVPRKDDLYKTVAQLRKEVADVFQRCIDEIKFVLDQRQLEDDEISRTLLRGEDPPDLAILQFAEDVLELLVVTQQIPQFDGSIPAVEQLSTLILGGWVVHEVPSTIFRLVLAQSAPQCPVGAWQFATICPACCKPHMAGFVEYCVRLVATNKESDADVMASDWPRSSVCAQQFLQRSQLTTGSLHMNMLYPDIGAMLCWSGLRLRSSSMEYQIDAATHLRKILSVERDPPIDKVLTLGVAPRLLELSQQSKELASLLSLIKLAGPDDPFQIPRLPPMYFEVLAPDLPLSSLQSMNDVLWASLVPIGPFISLLETLLGVGRPGSGGATATHSHTDEKEQTNRMLIDRETVPCVLSPLSTGSQVLASVDAEPGIGKSVATAMALLNYTQKVLLQGDFQKNLRGFVRVADAADAIDEYLKAVKTFTGKAEMVLNMTQLPDEVGGWKPVDIKEYLKQRQKDSDGNTKRMGTDACKIVGTEDDDASVAHGNESQTAMASYCAGKFYVNVDLGRKLQFETLWAILNIVSGDVHQTQVLEQGVWALGNIAGDSVQHRDLCISTGSLAEVLKVLEGTTKTSCIRNATWTVSNFCRGTPKPSLEAMLPALPVMARVLHNTDQEVLTDALWTVSYVSDGTERYIQAVLDAGVCQRVVELLSHDSPQVQTPALRTVGNIVTGSDTQTDAVLACEPFPALTRLVTSNLPAHMRWRRWPPTASWASCLWLPRSSREECCWLLSNICAGTVHQVQQVLNAGFFKVLADAAGDAEHSVKKEVAFALANASEKKSMAAGSAISTSAYVLRVWTVEAGCLNAMQAMLDSHDPKLQDLSVVFATNVCEAVQAHKTSREGTGREKVDTLLSLQLGFTRIKDLASDPPDEADLPGGVSEMS
ncbi:unnamed protein product [Symbiodinium sp. KB8]|nr:unnamed protein product [Symbiodinium sp. KB8]